MNKYNLDLNSELGIIEVEIYHKNIKNINLKVCPNRRVRISVPLRIGNEWIKNHLIAKKSWIIKQLNMFETCCNNFEMPSISVTNHIHFLGKTLKVNFIPALKTYFELRETELNIYIKSPNDRLRMDNLFNKFWKNSAKEIFQRELDILFDRFFVESKIIKPNLHTRKMKTLWGSCIPSKNKITINEHLLKKDLKSIQYVILHELAHLKIIHHNKDFYDFLTAKMPDWKERKQALSR